MRLTCISLLAAAAALASGNDADLRVPCCPATATAAFTTAIPSGDPCPATRVSLCYTSTALQLVFAAEGAGEPYFNATQGTNDDIWAYEVMEAFIHRGQDDPQQYFEYEVSPNNVTYNAFVYNPSRERKAGAPFDHAFVENPFDDGFAVNTVLDAHAETWTSVVSIPLALFNGENPKGSTWRMNFFRTITNATMFPDQKLCGWRNPGKPNFHITGAFGTVRFV
ncbi:hypothetical protein IWQ56_001126 [Coemansia nantahalensis]|uniref:Uncharacterized protein n=1 Tax=Coemansia nantahalensis TaxID=2789366 RepID=A0ACC1K0T4_9FUNG|nr:hypothetical protein IWQ57_002355 [Coemansia nantahalensis]KAJ2773060.1 hypothetical protein IWQ56_001126 [Coemansia nantahalensis]